MLSSNIYRLVAEGGQAEEIVAAEQLKLYHSESPESTEVNGEGDSEPASSRELLVCPEIGAIPKKARGRPPRLRNEATTPVELPPALQGVPCTPRKERGGPRKHP